MWESLRNFIDKNYERIKEDRVKLFSEAVFLIQCTIMEMTQTQNALGLKDFLSTDFKQMIHELEVFCSSEREQENELSDIGENVKHSQVVDAFLFTTLRAYQTVFIKNLLPENLNFILSYE